MKMKTSKGASSVHVSAGAIPANPNGGKKILSGKPIVMKAINTHRANPGFKKGK